MIVAFGSSGGRVPPPGGLRAKRVRSSSFSAEPGGLWSDMLFPFL